MTRDCCFCLPVPDELALLSTPLQARWVGGGDVGGGHGQKSERGRARADFSDNVVIVIIAILIYAQHTHS